MGTADTTGVWSDASLGSNIIAAQSFLAHRTGRQFEALTGTKKFTTEGRTYMVIPDLRVVSSVAINGSALTADSSYYLIPDKRSVIRGLDNAIREVSARIGGDKDRRVRSCLKYVAIEPSFFELMPFSVVIYNAMTGPIDAILLEPMATDIGKDAFDGEAAVQMEAGEPKLAHPWQEKTFDVKIGDREIIEFLITTFQDRWNKGIELECAQASAEDQAFLNSTWRIP